MGEGPPGPTLKRVSENLRFEVKGVCLDFGPEVLNLYPQYRVGPGGPHINKRPDCICAAGPFLLVGKERV